MMNPDANSKLIPAVDISDENRSTRRLTFLYVTALSMVALLSITGQVFVQFALNTQGNDSRVINIAGRQRMLSQRLGKAALVISTAPDRDARAEYSKELRVVADLWERSHRGLQHGDADIGLPGANSPEVTRMFAAIEADHQNMLHAARRILEEIDSIVPSLTVLAREDRSPIATILNHEHAFVEGMDKIVFQYDKEAKARVSQLKIIEFSLLAATLLILTLEGFFVFRPAVRKVTEGIHRLTLSNIEIEQKNQELSISEAEVSEKNSRIIDSLLYAERIQKVILPSRMALIQYFHDCFVLFHPKDIVSGDFYWFCELDGRMILAVGDCTGHGVPGALMSMFGDALLSQIVMEKNILQPATILEELHLGIRKALKQDQLELTDVGAQDGMDVAVCLIDPARRSILFSGAHRPLYYFYPGSELHEIKPDRKGIGGRQKESRRTFASHEIPMETGITLYLTTDGFADQPNEEGVKYGMTRLKKLLAALNRDSHPLARQHDILEQELTDHRGSEPQRDDITIVGVRIDPAQLADCLETPVLSYGVSTRKQDRFVARAGSSGSGTGPGAAGEPEN